MLVPSLDVGSPPDCVALHLGHGGEFPARERRIDFRLGAL
jgi:hypothetical protein